MAVRWRPQRGRTGSRKRNCRLIGAFLSSLALLLQGCYETLPLEQGAPPVAAGVQLALNDKGRVEVASTLGSGVDRVEGMITSQTSDSYTLAVSQVYQLGGASSKWNGEPVTIPKDGTVGYRIHRFSQQRTVILAVVIVGAAVGFLLSVKLLGNGSGTDTGPGGGIVGQSH